MSKKTDLVKKILAEVTLRQPLPKKRDTTRPLIDEVAFMVLLRHMTETQAGASLDKLRSAFPDWNECRVSQAQEIAIFLKAGRSKKGVELARYNSAAAQELKEVLHEVFQKTHGLDLEFLREDITKTAKPLLEAPLLGLPTASHLLFLAADEQIPVHAALMKLLDKLGLIPKTTSVKKATESISKVVPKGKEYEFTLKMHEVLDLWEDPDNPSFERFKVLQTTPFGKKAHADREALLKRLEAQRKREEERQRREEERERKRQEAEARKRQKEAEAIEKKRRRAAEKKRRELERQRKAAAAAKAKIEAQKKREAEAKRKEKERIKEAKAEARRKEAARKKAIADKKKAAAKRKADAKKAAAAKKKAAAKKAASKKAASRKKAAKKTTKKTTSRKKATKKATKRPATRKTTKKKAAKKTTKKVTKRPAAKKSTTKKKSTKKTAKKTTKKTTARKSTTRKKSTTKKKTTRRR